VNEFVLRNEDGEPLNDTITIVFIELTKLKKILHKPVAEMTALEMWSIFLQYADKDDYRDIINLEAYPICFAN
jgi:hypothetical protein